MHGRNEDSNALKIRDFIKVNDKFDFFNSKLIEERSFEVWDTYFKSVASNQLFSVILNMKEEDFAYSSENDMYWEAKRRLEELVKNEEFSELLNASLVSERELKRAYCFCVAETYLRMRVGLRCQFTSTLASASSHFSYLIPSFFKPLELVDKEEGAITLKKFICSQFELTELDAFLKETGLEKDKLALQDGILGLFTQLITREQEQPKAAMQYS